jgi:hypothetical protein
MIKVDVDMKIKAYYASHVILEFLLHIHVYFSTMWGKFEGFTG